MPSPTRRPPPQPWNIRNRYYVINNDLYVRGRSNRCALCDLTTTRTGPRPNRSVDCPHINETRFGFGCVRRNYKRVTRITPKQYAQLAAWTLTDFGPTVLKQIRRMLKRVQSGILSPEGV